MTSQLTEDVRARLVRVKLLVLDVDGVLTDGSLYYTEHGEDIKKFHVRDGQGIKLVQQAGIEVALVSGNASAAVQQRARALGITHVFLRSTSHACLAATAPYAKFATCWCNCTHRHRLVAQHHWPASFLGASVASGRTGSPAP
jgi:hypothetical protein